MNLLVTGGCGFIGSNFIRHWFKNHPEDKITNLDALTYAGNSDNLKDLENNPNYKFVHGNILDSELVDKLTQSVDTVVHFAAESHVDRSIENPTLFLETNLLGTGVLLNSALKNKVKRFHHVSTDEVFGELDLDTNKKFTEDTPYDPRSPYSASKAAADHLVRSYFHTYSMPVTISNCSNNFGPYCNVEKFIPRAITNIINGDKIKIYGTGEYVRDWLYVEDHCRAIELIINKGKIGDTYLVGGQKTQEINNLTLAKTILKILNKSYDYIEFVTDRPGHDKRYAVDFSKIERELGWSPQYEFETNLEKTINWYIENEWYWKGNKQSVEDFYAKIKR